MPRTEYLNWTDRWIRAVSRVMRPEGLAVPERGSQAHGSLDSARSRPGRPAPLPAPEHDSLGQVDCDRPGCRRAVGGLDRDVAVGHYKPINSDRFVNDCHEFIFHFTPAGRTRLDRRAVGVPYQDRSNIARWATAGNGLRCRGNTWFIPYETIQSRDRDRPHPASFPPKVPEQCLRLHGAAARRRRARSISWPRGLSASPRPGWVSTSSASRWTTTTSRKPSSASKRSTRTRRTKKARRGDLGHHVALGLLFQLLTSGFELLTS